MRTNPPGGREGAGTSTMQASCQWHEADAEERGSLIMSADCDEIRTKCPTRAATNASGLIPT